MHLAPFPTLSPSVAHHAPIIAFPHRHLPLENQQALTYQCLCHKQGVQHMTDDELLRRYEQIMDDLTNTEDPTGWDYSTVLVRHSDTVWHLGDFTLANGNKAEQYARRLNGKINLIWGNHDRNAVRNLQIWRGSQYATEIKLDGYRLTLCHYAMRVWNKCHRGALMLRGHSHGNLPGTSQSLDVGVDAWDFRPVCLEQILERLKDLPPYRSEDHHVSELDLD